MNVELEIKLGIGLSELQFGTTMAEAEKIFGKAEEIEFLDGIDDCNAIVWHYWKNGFTLFFDENNLKNFNCAEIDNSKAKLWGQEIFNLDEKQIIELFKSKGLILFEMELHEWGENRLSFDDATIDFYFEKNKLCSVNYGKSTQHSSLLILPN